MASDRTPVCCLVRFAFGFGWLTRYDLPSSLRPTIDLIDLLLPFQVCSASFCSAGASGRGRILARWAGNW